MRRERLPSPMPSVEPSIAATPAADVSPQAMRPNRGAGGGPALPHQDGGDSDASQPEEPVVTVIGPGDSNGQASEAPQSTGHNVPGSPIVSAGACSNPNSPRTSSNRSSRASSPRSSGGSSGARSRQEGGRLTNTLSPVWRESSSSHSFGTAAAGSRVSSPVGSPQTPGSPLMLPLSDPELGEGTAGFEPATRCTPGCQGTNCPSACCSPEGVYLVDLLHAVEGAAASPRDFLSPRSPVASGGPLPSPQQQQQLGQQQPHFHPDRGPSAMAVSPGTAAPTASVAIRIGSGRASASPWVLQQIATDEKRSADDGPIVSVTPVAQKAGSNDSIISRECDQLCAYPVPSHGEARGDSTGAPFVEGGAGRKPNEAAMHRREQERGEEHVEKGGAATADMQGASQRLPISTGVGLEPGARIPSDGDNATADNGTAALGSQQKSEYEVGLPDAGQEIKQSDGEQVGEHEVVEGEEDTEMPVQQQHGTQMPKMSWFDDIVDDNLVLYKNELPPMGEDDPWMTSYETFVR